MQMNRLKRCWNFSGKNTPIRQEYIIRNLRFEHDLVDEEVAESKDADNLIPLGIKE